MKSPPRRSTILVRLVLEVLAIYALAQAIATAGVQHLGEPVASQLRALATIAWSMALAAPFIYLRGMAATSRLATARTGSGRMSLQRGGRTLRMAVIGAITVQCLGTALTVGVVEWQRASVHARARLHFSRQTDELMREIQRRFEAPLEALRAARAAYTARGALDRLALRSFASSYDVEHIGQIRGIGLIERVPRADLDAFVARTRAESGHAFAVRSTGTHDPLYVIKAIEPIARNRPAWGLDVGQETRRRAAAEAAVDSGSAQLTGVIRLVQDTTQTPGFLLYMPVYENGTTPGDVAARRATLVGLFYTPIVARELLADVARDFGGTLDVELFDGDAEDPNALIFDEDGRLESLATVPSLAPFARRFASERRGFEVAGRPLVLNAGSTAAFEKTIDLTGVWLSAAGGAVMTLLAALAAWTLGAGRVRAENRARAMTADLEASLRDNEALLRTIHAQTIVSVTDARGVIVDVNDAFCEISGYSRDELIGHTHVAVNSGVHDDAFWRELWTTIERGAPWRGRICNRAKSGALYWVDSMIAPFTGADGRIEKYVSMRMDVTPSVRDREALAHERRRLDQILEGTHVGTWEWNVQTGETRFNERWAEMIGFTLSELGPTSIETWGRFTHPDDLRVSAVALERHFDGLEQHYECEARMRHKDGHWVWVLDRGKLFSRADDGRPLWMAGTHMDITQRKAAEAALRASQALLDRVGRIASVGGWALEFSSREVHVSDEVARLLDLDSTVAPTLPRVLAALGGRAGVSMALAVEAAERHGTGWDVEWPIVRPDGSTRWLRSLGEVGVDDQGRPARVVGTLQDVTARRDLQNELSRKNVLFESVLENLPFGLVVFDADLRLVTSNRRFGELLDLPDEIANRPGATLEALVRFNVARGEYGDGDPEEVSARVMQLLCSDRDALSHERVRPNGMPLEIRRAPMPGGGHIDTFTDITERKRIEARIERSEALLRGALEAVDEAFVVYDPDDRLVLCNDKYRAIYGTSAPAIVPGATFESIIRYGAERGQYRDAIGRVDAWVAERLSAHRATREPFVQTLDDGRIVRVVERRMVDGHIVGFRIDVTDLERARMAAEDASQAKSRFLANMSHEIRTPMNAVLGMLTLLRRSALDAAQSDHAAKAEGAARALLGLLNDVLDFSKIEAGKLTLEARPFSRDAWLQELGVVLSTAVVGKPVDVLFDIDPALPARLVGDELRLRQVFVNLAGNAVKFTAQGEVVIALRVAARDGTRLRVDASITDTGIGIAPEHQKRVFDAFTQAEASTTRRYGGTGLGVPISQRLVAAMGGDLGLHSRPGVGTTWSFSIDLGDATNEAIDATTGAATDATTDAIADTSVRDVPAHDATHVRAVVVDDNATARRLFDQAARVLGWTVTVAGNVDEARRALEGARVDVLFCDGALLDALPGDMPSGTASRMPGPCDGSIVVRMVTSVLEDTAATSGGACWDAVLAKPFSSAMLAEAFARGLKARRGGTAAPAPRELPTRLVGLRVLVVDDNPTNREIARELLAAEGAQVALADNGARAVDMLVAAPEAFDIVLMDLQMPVMDGLTAARTIRGMPALSTLPIVAMTANAMASDRQACIEAGMNDHVGKPFDLDHLVAVVLRHASRATGAAPLASTAHATTAVQPPAGDESLVGRERGGVDLAGALARFGGRHATLLRSLRAFVVDLEASPARLAALLEGGRRDDAWRLMHTHKGLAATVGAATLAAQAAAIEQQLRAGTIAPAEAASAWQRCVAEARDVLGAADAELARQVPGDAATSATASAAQHDEPTGDALRAALGHLDAMLRARDIRAEAAFDAVRACAGAGSRARLDAVGRALERFDFDTAREQVRRWRDALGAPGASDGLAAEPRKAPSTTAFSTLPAKDAIPE